MTANTNCFLRVQVVISENRSYEECASPNLTKNVCKHKVRHFITKKLISMLKRKRKQNVTRTVNCSTCETDTGQSIQTYVTQVKNYQMKKHLSISSLYNNE